MEYILSQMKPFSWRITEGATDLMQIWAYSDFIDMILIFLKRTWIKFQN